MTSGQALPQECSRDQPFLPEEDCPGPEGAGLPMREGFPYRPTGAESIRIRVPSREISGGNRSPFKVIIDPHVSLELGQADREIRLGLHKI